MLSEVPNAGTFFGTQLEEDDFTAWTATANGASSSIAISNTQKHHGLYSAKIVVGSGSGWAECRKSFTGVSTLYRRYYFWLDSHTISSGAYAWLDEDTTNYAALYTNRRSRLGIYNDAGTLKWGLEYKNAAAFTDVHSATTLTTGQWYCCKVEVIISATVGEYHVWIGGTELADIAQTGKNTGTSNLVALAVGCSDAVMTAYYDCVVLSTSDISVENRPPLVNDSSDNTAVQVVARAGQTVAATALKSMYNLDACGL